MTLKLISVILSGKASESGYVVRVLGKRNLSGVCIVTSDMQNALFR
jgi:hypothetical protein